MCTDNKNGVQFIFTGLQWEDMLANAYGGKFPLNFSK
jgi:hypothetical protein